MSMLPWISIKDKIPPFDTLVLVRHLYIGEEVTIYKNFKPCLVRPQYYEYAVAYNECYPPDMVMTQVLTLPKSVCVEDTRVPFEIEEWMELER